MIPVGYMYKTVSKRPDWLNVPRVVDIYSVANCVSNDFADWINYWKHNGYWFFDTPAVIESIAEENNISLKEMKLFYYKAYEKQWDSEQGAWVPYQPENSFPTSVVEPEEAILEGYDVVSFSCQTSAECSPLSCNHIAEAVSVNGHCLLKSLDEARSLVESNLFADCEQGPYRIFEVYSAVNA